MNSWYSRTAANHPCVEQCCPFQKSCRKCNSSVHLLLHAASLTKACCINSRYAILAVNCPCITHCCQLQNSMQKLLSHFMQCLVYASSSTAPPYPLPTYGSTQACSKFQCFPHVQPSFSTAPKLAKQMVTG